MRLGGEWSEPVQVKAEDVDGDGDLVLVFRKVDLKDRFEALAKEIRSLGVYEPEGYAVKEETAQRVEAILEEAG